MKAYTDINIGYTFAYLGQGVVFIIAGGLSFFLNYVLAVGLILAGTALLSLREGIAANSNTNRIKKYYALFTIKFGLWMETKGFDCIELKYTNESQTFNSRGSSTTVRTKTFDLVLTKKSDVSIELHDFTNYAKAKQALESLSDTLGLEAIDRIEEIRSIALTKRKERRR